MTLGWLLPWSTNGGKQSRFYFFKGDVLIKKILSVFIDESGDFGFIKDASKYYLTTLVFHDQSIDISSNIEKIKDKPVF